MRCCVCGQRGHQFLTIWGKAYPVCPSNNYIRQKLGKPTKVDCRELLKDLPLAFEADERMTNYMIRKGYINEYDDL